MQVSIVVPCYNEEKNIYEFYKEVSDVFSGIEYEVIFVNDGSRDNTLQYIRTLVESNPHVSAIDFSRNFGKEAAIYAGLQKAEGEYVGLIDADLQQPPAVLKQMYEFLLEDLSYDEVAAFQEKRNEGHILGFFKNQFYKIINLVSEVEFYKNASDFRMMRKKVVDAILSLPEYFRFSKGIFSWVGFHVHYIPYQVRERHIGKSSWSFWKLLQYAVEGLVSFSTLPLRLTIILGFFTSLIAILYMIFVIIQKIVFGIVIPGYPTIIVLILLLGGIQLIVLGVIGGYLARVHIEVKHRPIYIVRDILESDKKSTEGVVCQDEEINSNEPGKN